MGERPTPLEGACLAGGLRLTQQVRALCRMLSEANDHPDAHELHRRCRAYDQSISTATVYRALARMVKARLVLQHDFGFGRARYELPDRYEHGHLIDLDSGEAFEFPLNLLADLEVQLSERFGYEIKMRRLEFFGSRRERPKTSAAPGAGAPPTRP